MSFPRYERYKDSGVEWLGEIPEHWDVLPLKRAFNIVGGSTPSSEVETYWGNGCVWVTPADLSKIDNQYIYQSERTITKQGLKSCSSSLVPAGSIVLSTRAPIGSLAIAGVELCTNQGCKSLVPMPGTVSSAYVFLLSIMTEELQIRGKGTTFLEISADVLGSVEIPRPPTEEQKRIGKFLEAETAKIDVLIEEQRRLILLLKEKRQAVISHAVTKGLNPNAAMKVSGADWLSEIPTHWASIPLGYLIRFNSGGTPNKANERYWDGDIPWVSPKDMKVVEISDTEDHVTELALSETGLRLIEPGHILVVVRGMILLHSFPVARNLVPVTINQDMKALKCCDKLMPCFLQYVFIGIGKLLVSFAGESAHGTKKMETSVLSGLQIPLPPVEEQQAISIWLGDKLAGYDSLLDGSAEAIRLLEQRRSALISAAVTGKIDVRNYTPKEAA